MSSAHKRPVVLLAEDSEDDAFFFRWTLRKSGLDCELIHASDGAEAVEFLKSCARPGGAHRPDLVFLDLKMPAFTGFEVLDWLREHPFDPPLDIAILSGSDHSTDIARATALGATGYFVKPIAPDKLQARFAQWHAAHAEAAGPHADASFVCQTAEGSA